MRISNLNYQVGEFTLHVDDLKLDQPQIYALCGDNGAGKSTLLKLIGQLLPISPQVIDYTPLTLNQLTMVFQKPYIFHQSVRANLSYPLTVRKQVNETLVDEYLSKIGLMEKQHLLATKLSYGEKQKLALARALIIRPQMILLDEPFANLDHQTTRFFIDWIKTIQTVNPIQWILVSHHWPHIEALADQVIVIDQGQTTHYPSINQALNQSEFLKQTLMKVGN